MRFLTIGLFSAGLAIGACNRVDATAAESGIRPAQPAAPAGAGRATSSDSGTAADASRVPVATTGTSDGAQTARRVEWREVTIPAGTRLPVILETPVGSDISHAEEPVRAHLARAISVRGQKALAEGSHLSGVVTSATRSARVKGLAHVSVRFDTLVPTGEEERYKIQTAAVVRTAPATKKKDALEIGAPAAGGAIIGGLLGGKKGALVGTAVGGGGGAAVVLSTRGKEIHLPKGAALTLKLSQPLTVKVRG
jgi:hypothetical protein